jgi:esterase
MRLHFRAQGQGGPLVILHGFLGSLENWQIMNKRLARDFNVYALDLRNHGRSPHSEVMNYAVMAQDVREFIAQQRLSAPFVLGHSMGGKVAMQLATNYPDAAGKIVVVDIAPKAYPPSHRPMLSAMRGLDLDAYRTFAAIDHALSDAIPDPRVRQFIIKNLNRDGDGKFQWRLGLDEIIRSYDELTKPVIAQKQFTKSACFIRAGHSNFVQDSDMAGICQSFPRAEFRIVANAGHWVHIEAPDEFQTIVTNFLKTPAG